MISNSDIEKILDRADIVDVVGQFVQLQRSGVRYKACCPFHQEDTPSFMVDQARGLWYCFGACKEGGNVIKFVEKINNMNFLPGPLLQTQPSRPDTLPTCWQSVD